MRHVSALILDDGTRVDVNLGWESLGAWMADQGISEWSPAAQEALDEFKRLREQALNGKPGDYVRFRAHANLMQNLGVELRDIAAMEARQVERIVWTLAREK